MEVQESNDHQQQCQMTVTRVSFIGKYAIIVDEIIHRK